MHIPTRFLILGLAALLGACQSSEGGGPPARVPAPRVEVVPRADGDAAAYAIAQLRVRFDAAAESEVRRLTDQARSLNGGLSALYQNTTLQAAARAHSRALARGRQPDRSPLARLGAPDLHIKSSTYQVRSLARGGTPAALMNDPGEGWLNNATTRANILNSAFTDVGVGVAIGRDGRVHVTQVFAERGL